MTEITDIASYMHTLGQQARSASRRLASATTAEKNNALYAIADDLQTQREVLMQENKKDLEAGAAKAGKPHNFCFPLTEFRSHWCLSHNCSKKKHDHAGSDGERRPDRLALYLHRGEVSMPALSH